MDNLLGYIIDARARTILDHFTGLFGVRIAFFSKQGQELAVGRNKSCCDYCRLIREKLGLVNVCLAGDQKSREKATASRHLVAYHCHAGLLEAVFPVYVYNYLIGYVMMGQCRTNDAIPAAIALCAKKRGLSATLEKAFANVPFVAPEKTESLLSFFMLLVQYIVSNNLVNVKNNLIIDQVADYIRKNLDRPIRLAEAARVAGRSPTAITHLIKKISGKSFKHLCLELKLDEAERLLKTVPAMTVAEAAFKVGFDDPLYFSRIFKKYKNKSPSFYKNILKSKEPSR